jgi:hypothetical protein
MQGVMQLPAASCWTGNVAAWVPFPGQQQAEAWGLPPLKSSSRGVWLRSDAGGVLMVQCRPAAPPLLVCTLRRSVELARTSLVPGEFAFKLLCPQMSAAAAGGGPGTSAGHVLLLTLRRQQSAVAATAGPSPGPSTPSSCTIAVHFDTAHAGRECGALLSAIQQGRLRDIQPEPQPVLPSTRPATQPGSLVLTCATGNVRQGQQAFDAPAADHASCARKADGVAAVATSTAVPTSTGVDEHLLFGFQDEASLSAALLASTPFAAHS